MNIVDVQVPDLIQSVVDVLSGIAQQRASLIQMTIQGIYDPLFAAFTPITDSIDTNLQNLQDIQDNTATIINELITLETTLGDVDTGNVNNQATCLTVKSLLSSGNQAAFQLICDQFDAFPSISLSIDYSSFPDLSSFIVDLTAVRDGDIAQYQADAQATIDDLFNTVQTTIADAQAEVYTQLTTFHSDVSVQFHDAVDQASMQFDEKFNAAEYNDKIHV